MADAPGTPTTPATVQDHTAAINECLRLNALDKLLHAAAALDSVPHDIVAADPRLSAVLATVAQVRHLQAESASDDGWEVVREAHGITASYKVRPADAADQGAHSIRVQGHVDSPLFNLLAVLYEVDLYTQWMPSNRVLGLRSSAVLQQPHPTHLIVQILLNFPWPLSDRELTLTVHGVDCMDPLASAPEDTTEGPQSTPPRQVVVLLHSTPDAAAPPPSYVRARMLEGGVVLAPSAINGGGRGTHITILARVDPQLKNIPMSLINFTVQHLAFYFLDLLAEQSRDTTGTEHEKRINADARGFYDFVTQRLAGIGFTPADL